MLDAPRPSSTGPAVAPEPTIPDAPAAPAAVAGPPVPGSGSPRHEPLAAPPAIAAVSPAMPAPSLARPEARRDSAESRRAPADVLPPVHVLSDPNGERRVACTTAQLRRFIKSRPWVPMHELRRRFAINGADDDVTPISVGDARLFVGLPPAEGRVLAELLGGGDVGYELSVDPVTPIVIGVYPMRPVPRT